MRPSAAEVIETSTSNNLPLREFEPNPDPRKTCAYTKKLLTSGEISFDSNQESNHLGIADYLSKHCVCNPTPGQPRSVKKVVSESSRPVAGSNYSASAVLLHTPASQGQHSAGR